ncbi:MAG: sulfatase [Leptospiraceae bacterium]|nr:sulfatase [Leptospiraceae bacterium]
MSVDLSRELNSSEFTGEIPDEKIFPPDFWKKNPGRYSNLNQGEKWKNSQVTFKTSEEFLLNHSLDSVVFSKNSIYKFQNLHGDFLFSGKFGILSNENIRSSGILKIYSDDKIIGEFQIDSMKSETWKEFSFPIKILNRLQLEWISENSSLILGAPILSKIASKKKYNILFIVIDAVRKDAMGYSGFPIPVSPNLDKLSKESVVFENAFVNANWTKPSMISMLYSDYSSALGLGNIGFQVENYRKKIFYSPNKKNIVEVLRNNGYYTAAIMNNVFFLDYTGVGVDLGFHEIFQIGKEVKDTKKIIDEAIEFSEKNKNRNYFLHLNLNTPHTPYLPPKRILENLKENSPSSQFSKLHEYEKKYLGEIRYADEELGRLFSYLKQIHQFDDSFIVVTSDHGELLNEYHDSKNHSNGGVRFGHGESLFDEELNVPYLIKLPKDIQSIAKVKQIPDQVSLLSFAPTVLSLAKIHYDKEKWKGKDYSEFILYEKDFPKEEVILSEGRLSEAIRTNQFKYVRRYPGYYSNKKISSHIEQLYDFTKDPNEKTNIAEENIELLKKARSFMDSFSIKRNQYRIHFPVCSDSPCQYFGEISLKGSIYRVLENPNIQLQELSKKHVSFSVQPSTNISELIIETVNPEFEFSLNINRNNQKIGYRIGRFGLSKGIDTEQKEHSILFTSERPPYGYESSKDVWIYNDSQFSKVNSSKEEVGMGEEVRSILKSWGYIHE